jgi:hypothetical protein
MRLPATLARALVEQNGGRMRESELVIDPLDNFSTLEEEEWADVIADGSLRDLERAKLLYIGDAAGCGIVLDYNREPEPRVLLVHHEVGGELRDEGIGSFERRSPSARTAAPAPPPPTPPPGWSPSARC